MDNRAALREEIAAAMRRVELAEARVAGLVRALVAETSALWYSRDAERQRIFEEAFSAGRAILERTEQEVGLRTEIWMRVVSLFAGIGGFDRALERAGFTVTHQVEREPFCQRVLAARFPHAAIWPDVRDFAGGAGTIDILCGGFPCQDLSVAGKRAGLAGERSGLFWEIVRIAKTLTPTWGLFENVPGLFSSHGGRDLATVLEGLRQCWPVVGYRVLDSRYWGVAQKRRRVFLVGGPAEASVEQVLFESEGGGGDLAPGGEAGPDVAASLRSRSHRPGVNPPGRGGEDDMNLVVAHPLMAKGNCSFDDSMETYVAGCLNSAGNQGGFRTEPGEHLVAQCHGSDVGAMGALRAGNGSMTGGIPFMANRVGVRRLTPTECERLQGFPDLWTCLCEASADREWSVKRLPDDRINRCICPDGPRYKALGNAVTVPVVEWLARRIVLAEK